MKQIIKREYCNCVLHYVCYMGDVCMNQGCGKPHQFIKSRPKSYQNKVFKDIKRHMVVNARTGEPAWSKMDGSVGGDIAYRERAFVDQRKQWWEFWK